MFFVYVLNSDSIHKHYVGYTADIIQRLGQHNAGLSKWTQAGRPWRLVHQEPFLTRSEAVRRERFYKSGRGREELKRILAIRALSSRWIESAAAEISRSGVRISQGAPALCSCRLRVCGYTLLVFRPSCCDTFICCHIMKVWQ